LCVCGQPLLGESQFCHRCGTAVSPQTPLYRLVSVTKGRRETMTDITRQELTIGKSSSSDIVLRDDDYVSREHAQVVQRDNGFFIEDLDSSNGTFIRIQRPVALADGDEILVGTHILRFEAVHP